MSIELKMPALSPTMERGTLAKWLVSVGDPVKPGDLLAEIETDKATMEVEAVDEGRIAAIVVAAGTEDVCVGTVIAVLGDSDGVASTPQSYEIVAAEPGAGSSAISPEMHSATRGASADGIEASPLARRIAKAKGVDLKGVAGSGADGRIVLVDLGVPAPRPQGLRGPASIKPALEPKIAPPHDIPFDATALSSMRRTIARRLTEAKQSVPHFYLSVHCVLDGLLRLRAELNADLAPHGVKLSVNDFLLRAMAIAMVRVPEVNVQFAGDELYSFRRVDIAMAVAIEGGLITPVLRDVASLSLSAIARQSKALARKAHDGALMPEEYQGGTASLSNLGMFGIDDMIPVINPPQALILGAGASRVTPWTVDGGIELATVISLTASFDHRAIDGAVAARFMSALRDTLENPITLLC